MNSRDRPRGHRHAPSRGDWKKSGHGPLVIPFTEFLWTFQIAIIAFLSPALRVCRLVRRAPVALEGLTFNPSDDVGRYFSGFVGAGMVVFGQTALALTSSALLCALFLASGLFGRASAANGPDII